MESTIAVTSQGLWRDHPDGAQSAGSTRNVAAPDDESDDDHTTKLSDVFIDFSGELGDELHSTTGAADGPDGTIAIEGAVCHTSATVRDWADNIRRLLRPHRNLS